MRKTSTVIDAGFPLREIGIEAVLIGIEILQYFAEGAYELIIVLLVTVGAAVWSARSFEMLPDLHWLPKLKLGGGRKKPAKRKHSGPVVVEGRWPTTPTYTPMQDQAAVDRILDKIARSGIESLSQAERNALQRATDERRDRERRP